MSLTNHRARPRAAGFAAAAFAALLALALLPGCRESSTPGQADGGRSTPAAAVQTLAGHLRAGDLAGYARDAVPPALHAELEAAWRDGRSRWPLSELPMAGRIEPLLAAFAAEGAEETLRAAFARQFAGAERELDAAAQSLALFGVEYVRNEGDFSDAERRHYAQAIQALGAWAVAAPLADAERARESIARLSAAARATDLDEPADFASLGMTGSLDRLKPFFAATKRTLAGYGLDLDATLAGLRVETVSREGDRAVVRVRYALAGKPVSTEMELQRIDGRWYPVDSIRNARATLSAEAPAGATPAATGQAASDAPGTPADAP